MFSYGCIGDFLQTSIFAQDSGIPIGSMYGIFTYIYHKH